ncbi:CBO0543 family protein [Paenibacillus aestuarii]|uniref:CBO0543 family protein n=1 Tax=Paenibacillus aestuarii TaxID=516965 RepID=UPI0022E9B108|nr:CBO0543 family protein [Paenibacillus aestuarii]
MTGNHLTDAYEEVQKARDKLHQLTVHQWKHETVFTWEWWLLVGLSIFPLIIWWRIVDKKRAYEIAFYGCMINIMAVILDDLGTNLSWWGYPMKLIPIIPPLLTADSILVPIILMVVYQLFSSNWKTFISANILTGAVIAFVAEPIFVWIGYYHLNTWKFIYSFLFYITASSLARLIILRISK